MARDFNLKIIIFHHLNFVTNISMLLTHVINCLKLFEVARNNLISSRFVSQKSKWMINKLRMLQRRSNRKKRTLWVANGRTDAWWEKMIGEDISNHIWKKNFRMTKETFQELADHLRPKISPGISPNYRSLSTEKNWRSHFII